MGLILAPGQPARFKDCPLRSAEEFFSTVDSLFEHISMRAQPRTLLKEPNEIVEIHLCYFGKDQKREVRVQVCSDVVQNTLEPRSGHPAARRSQLGVRGRISLG